MPQKKISDEFQNENLHDLNEGEKVIITDQRTIEKKTVPAQINPAQIHNQIEDFEDDEEENAPQFSENSIAAFISSDGDDLENELCTISIRREPDNLGDNFLNPQKSRLSLQPLRNVELTTDRTDLEERVREINGGGHYYFQVFYGGRLARSWKASLSDPAEAIANAKAEKQSQTVQQFAPAPAANTPAANPFDQFFETLERQKKMKDLLFGEELKEIERLRLENEKLTSQMRLNQSDAPPNEKLQILQYVEKMQNADIQSKVLGFVFDEADTGGGLLDTTKYLIEHGDQVMNFANKAISALFGNMPTTAAPTQNDIANLLKGNSAPAQKPITAQPKQKADQVAIESRSTFKRAKAKPEKN